MGLDMYLSARRSFYKPSWQTEPTEETKIVDKLRAIKKIGWPPETENLNYVKLEVEIAYWRKANQIHKWFVDNVQDGEDNCQPYSVSREQLTQLRDLCATGILAKPSNEWAKENLPPTEGFFFGGAEVDEYYWDDLTNTVNQLNKALDETPENWEFTYQSSW